MTENYGDSTTPCSYGNIINIAGAGTGQLFVEWTGNDNGNGHLYYRSHRDTSTGGWSTWMPILDTLNFISRIMNISGTNPGANHLWCNTGTRI